MNIKSLFLSACLLIPSVSFAQIDSMEFIAAVDSLNTEIAVLKDENVMLRKANELLATRINSIERKMKDIESAIFAGNEKVTQLEVAINRNTDSLNVKTTKLVDKISNAQSRVDEQRSVLKSRTWIGVIIVFIILVISAMLTLVLHKKGKDENSKRLSREIGKLNGEIIDKLSVEISEMQKISSSINALSSVGTSTETEQGLIKILADRITFMEMTLSKMDDSVRGYKQLKKSIDQMKNNLLANGYEIVDMLGKDYHGGMKVIANFKEDDSLAEGKQIITGIIKPQINYQGKMIQSAQITVSQNI